MAFESKANTSHNVAQVTIETITIGAILTAKPITISRMSWSVGGDVVGSGKGMGVT
jgi:hypothetical protein